MGFSVGRGWCFRLRPTVAGCPEVYQADPLVCRACGGRLQIVAYITDELSITRAVSPLLPYFSLSAPNRFVLARAMHNHWVTQRCITRLDRAAGTSQRLQSHVTSQINKYERGAVNAGYAGVYPLAADISAGTWRGLS